MNDDTTTRFIASLVKSLQSLCHGYVEFEKNIEIIGHIYLNIDSQQKYDYVVNEQVCKNDDESQAMFVSNSFHAQPPRTTVKTARQCNALDLKIQSAKDNIGIDLSTFQTDVGQGRSASRESSQSLSAGSETGSVSGNVPNREPGASPSLHCQNPERSVSRRKRHLHDLSSKPSPDVSPSSRIRDGERRDHHDNTSLRSQYTLGASASKLARRISNELEKQGLATPAQIDIDGEIHARLSASNETRFGRNGQGASQRQFSDDSSKHIDSTKDPPEKSEGQSFADSIDLSRVKEEVIEDESLFDQLDWNRTTRDTDQETYDPQAEGHEASEDQIVAENLAAAASSSLYPVMIHQNTAGLPMPGYGSPVFPQNFSEPTHTMSASSSPIASTSGQLSPGAVFGGRRTQPGNSGRGRTLENYVEFVRPSNYPVGRGPYSAYREKLKQENPVKWMNFMWRERERVKKERAVLKERDDEQALMKKERIRIQNRLRKRKERQRKRERELMAIVKTETDSAPSDAQLRNAEEWRKSDVFLHSSFKHHAGCDVNL
ncbi:uncharacterized protein LOC124287837 isoform X5 [Haliotis rubra]|uniref:uncharacterized protein LOC124287837 isoform X5 n=1 Tax=Haliotis rubra TaxID=36100 RepID=UPI001EE526B0|nr:uncharacterized protein LOC124287837 isoform X5 [Haliotis rubra]